MKVCTLWITRSDGGTDPYFRSTNQWPKHILINSLNISDLALASSSGPMIGFSRWCSMMNPCYCSWWHSQEAPILVGCWIEWSNQGARLLVWFSTNQAAVWGIEFLRRRLQVRAVSDFTGAASEGGSSLYMHKAYRLDWNRNKATSVG